MIYTLRLALAQVFLVRALGMLGLRDSHTVCDIHTQAGFDPSLFSSGSRDAWVSGFTHSV